MQNLENLENLYDFLNQISLRSPPVVRPEVGREPRGVQPFLGWLKDRVCLKCNRNSIKITFVNHMFF